jgi:DNA polymerase III subunit gamma/tau
VASQALYRKYRSKKLEEIVGQKHIVDVLKNAISQEKISHAYLFTGPRGTGKTSIARIFAHEVNKAEYNSEKTHLDIIEIDAASNSGVDDMRDLREKITSAPSSLKFKVYIIDEVHMLSGASFAALLKTIEEPPSHAIFILATTDAHKVPATIMSRVQKFYFRPIDLIEVENHLAEICKKEKIVFQKEALKLIAESTEGSMRDALSLLDQVASSGKEVDLASVQSSLGVAENSALIKLIDAIKESDNLKISENIASLISSGADPKAIAFQCYEKLKNELSTFQEIEVLSELLTLGSLTRPKLGLELALLKLSSLGSNNDHAEDATKNNNTNHEYKPKSAIPAIVETEAPTESITVSNKVIKEESLKSKPGKSEKNNTENNDSENTKNLNSLQLVSLKSFSENWSDVLESVAKKSPSLRAVLKPSTQKLTEKTYTLSLIMVYPIHLKMLNETKNKKILTDSFEECGLRIPKLETSLAEKKPSKSSRNKSEDNNNADATADLSDIIGLMGGGEAVQI